MKPSRTGRQSNRPRNVTIGGAITAATVAVLVWFAFLSSGTPELRAGFNRYIPFVIPGDNGVPKGLAVEIVTEAARRANVRLKWVASSDAIESDLRSGKIDFFPLLTVTPARLVEFHMSEPWWENETALISTQNAPVQVGPGTAGKRIAIRGLPLLKVLAQSLFPRSQLVTIPDIPDMVDALCSSRVDAAFLDVRLLQTELLRGPAACVGTQLRLSPVPGGTLSQASISRKDVADTADRLYEEIAELALDGTLSETASRWSLPSSFQNRHMKDIIDARQRARIMRYGIFILSLALVVTWMQSQTVRRAKRSAEESRQRFDAFMRHTPAITFIQDETGRVVYSNEALQDKADYPARVIADRLRAVSRAGAGTGDITCGAESMEAVSLDSGERKFFLYLRFPFSNSKGKKFAGSVALDITDRRNAEQELRFSQFSIEKSPDSILWADAGDRIFYANEAACEALGYSLAELKGMRLSEIYFNWNPHAGGSAVLGINPAISELAYRTRDKSFVPAELAMYRLEFDGAEYTCCISRNITERKRAERELAYQAKHDPLTGLPNRRCFEAALAECVTGSQRTSTGLAVYYLDLDRFKLINDTLGHATGDLILKQVVRRIQSCLRAGEVLARVGGDEFTLIAPGVDSRRDARVLAERILGCLQEKFTAGDNELMVTASIGVSMFPEDAPDGMGLLQNADSAMYEAKRSGKNRWQFFDRELSVTIRERLEIENNLRRAIDRNELTLHYQPEVRLANGEIVRYEALLRWNSAALGSVPPSKFIPVAEETGLIVPIGDWVLRHACLYAKRLFDAGIEAGIAVNVSSVQFARADFVATVNRALEIASLPPCLLELELTESVVMQGMEDVSRKIRQLRDSGVSVSIDDFGTGYSSLSYLQTLRVDSLKIDRSFVRDIPVDANALSLTQALVSLAHGLNMKVVVEGVETSQQLEAMRALGCDLVQGYYTGRPAPPIAVGILSETPVPA